MVKGIVFLWLHYPTYFPSTEGEGRDMSVKYLQNTLPNASLISETYKEKFHIFNLISSMGTCEW